MLFLLLACRPDPGAPSYPERTGRTVDTADTNFLSGPDPYQDGDKRLSLGIFYEGVITKGVSTGAADGEVQANIVAAGYGAAQLTRAGDVVESR